MSIIKPEVEIVDRSQQALHYIEHGWPADLCRWHAHEEYELHLILETSGTSFVGDFIGQFQPGSLYLTGPSLPHNWVTESTNMKHVNIRDMLVQFHDSSMQMAFHAFPEIAELQPLLVMAKSGLEFEEFPRETAQKHLEKIRDHAGMKRFVYFLQFLQELNEWPQKRILSITRMNIQLSEHSQSKISEIVNYVLHNYKDNIAMQDVADIAGMSQSSFSRYFSNQTGNRFSVFVNQVRVSKACKMLYETEHQISTICFACGFNSLANFNRQFLKIKGETPREYRAIARERLHYDI